MKQTDLAGMPRNELEAYAIEAVTEANTWKQKAELYEEQLRLMVKKQYGASSEQSKTDGNQLSLFNEAEEEAVPSQPEPKLEQVKKPRKKKARGAKEAKLKNVATKVTEYTLSEEEAQCPQCGSTMAIMKKTVRKEIEVIPAKVLVREHRSFVYVCRECERNAEHTPILRAPSPAPLLPGSLLSPSLAAWILCRKFEERAPLYQIEADFKARGLTLSRQTLSNWVLRTAERYGTPLYERLKEGLLQETYLHGDETPVQVLKEPGRKAESKSYMWLFTSNHTSAHPRILYHYAASRSGAVPRSFLQGYEGILQCDGYDGYNKVEGITRMGCLAHVRRKFVDAEAAMKRTAVQGRRTPAQKGVRWCNVLFRLDAKAKEVPQGQRLQWKQAHIRRKMDLFFRWAQKEREKAGPAKTALYQALNYCLNEQKYLENYLEDERIELSNNMAERSIRPFVVGRKNWLFCNTPRGAESSAVWYSVIQTAKENGLLPFEYLTYLFEQLRGTSEDVLNQEDLDRLLPWSDQIPDRCRRNQEEEET